MGRSNMCNIHTAKKTERTQEEITISGNPAKPQGEDGATMLKRMNESHSPVTCWALEHWQIAPEEELLDIGCGGGATLKRMGEKITTGHLTGIDYSPVSVKTSLKTNRQDVESGKMKVLEGSVEALPHLFTPTAEEFRKLFEKAGFTGIQIHVKEGTDWICVEGKK